MVLEIMRDIKYKNDIAAFADANAHVEDTAHPAMKEYRHHS
jgi:hypothetical protein